MELWMRHIELMAGSKGFNGNDFSIEFNIPFSTSSDPDVSEIKIYNLSKESLAAIESGKYVILNAGYRGDIGNVLSGRIEEFSSKWESVDKITTVKVSDGGLEWRNSTVQKTYAPGTTAKYMMQDLSGMLGLEVVDISPKKDITYPLGRTVSGSVQTILKSLAKDTDSKMYINESKFYIRDGDKGTTTGFLLNSGSGLIGSPEKTVVEEEKKKVIKYNVKCLLNHRITTDSIIKVESRLVNGTFRVESGNHVCNGTDFTTNMVAVPL